MVVKSIRSLDGEHEYVEVEHPAGWRMRVPIEWTDRSLPQVTPHIGGQQVPFTAPALLRLERAVRVALDQRLEPTVAPGAAPAPTLSHAHGSAPEARPPALVSAARAGEARTARRVGHSAAQGALRRGRKRGAKR
jgi:hypothetical protein